MRHHMWTLPLILILVGSMILSPNRLESCRANEEEDKEFEFVRVSYQSNLFIQAEKKDAEAALEVWVDKFVHGLGLDYTAKGTVFDDLQATAVALKRAKVDIVSLHILDFLSLRDQVKVEPFLFTSRTEAIKEEFMILTHAERGLESVVDLKGKTLRVQSGIYHQISTIWLDTLLLRENQQEHKLHLRTIEIVNKASQAILPVFFKQVDACIVLKESFANAVELNPQLGRELKVIALSPGYVLYVCCFRPEFRQDFKRDVIEHTSKLHELPEGQQILLLFNIKKLIPFKAKDINSVESLLEEHARLKELASLGDASGNEGDGDY